MKESRSRPGPRCANGLSVANRRRLLRALQDRADAGDAIAAGELVRLSLEVERLQRQPDNLAREQQ